jgi:hypothetical protein
MSRLQRHPIPMVTRFRHSLVLAYAIPAPVLAALVPPGLTVDTYGEFGFVAIALVACEDLRPVGFPARLGRDYVLTGYRVFVRHHDATGRLRRGLHILRSDTDRRSMVWGGNALTHYRYRRAAIRFVEQPGRIEVEIRTPGAQADLHVVAHVGDPSDGTVALPLGSPFTGTTDARRFAGPLPWTFDREAETDSIVMIRGRRTNWNPQPVAVTVTECTFFSDPRFDGIEPVLANAFHVADTEYRWDRGIRVPVGQP